MDLAAVVGAPEIRAGSTEVSGVVDVDASIPIYDDKRRQGLIQPACEFDDRNLNAARTPYRPAADHRPALVRLKVWIHRFRAPLPSSGGRAIGTEMAPARNASSATRQLASALIVLLAIRNTNPPVFAKFCGVCRPVLFRPSDCRRSNWIGTCRPSEQIAMRRRLRRGDLACREKLRSLPRSVNAKRHGDEQQRCGCHYGFSTRIRWASLSVT
jgi:hypothetical protein